MVLGLFPNVTATRFWGTSIWSCPMAWTIFRSVKHGMRPAHRCCWSGTWLSVPVVTEAQKNNNESNNSRMSSLELAERIWQDFHGRNPHTLLFNPQMCFPFKCDSFSNSIKLIAKNHWYNKEIINQAQILLRLLISLLNGTLWKTKAY